jgi:hypothetical protein
MIGMTEGNETPLYHFKGPQIYQRKTTLYFKDIHHSMKENLSNPLCRFTLLKSPNHSKSIYISQRSTFCFSTSNWITSHRYTSSAKKTVSKYGQVLETRKES